MKLRGDDAMLGMMHVLGKPLPRRDGKVLAVFVGKERYGGFRSEAHAAFFIKHAKLRNAKMEWVTPRRSRMAKSQKLIPHGNRLLVKRDEAEETSKGGIVLPDRAKKRPWRGEVLAVGVGKVLENGELWPINIEVGSVVLFLPHSGSEVEVDGETYLVINADDVLATSG